MSDLAPQPSRHTIKQLLEAETTRSRFRQIVPEHLTPERLIRICMLSLSNEKLAKCDPITLLGAFMVLGSLGLEPNTTLGHAYLLPFWNGGKKSYDVQLIVGYKGYIDLARRSGQLVSIHADVVRASDKFSYEYGTNEHLSHCPAFTDDQSTPLCAYAYAKVTGGQAFEVMSWPKVLAVRNSSAGYRAYLKDGYSTPWLTHEDEMAKKTAIRRLAKVLPLSPAFMKAAAIDSKSETGQLDVSAFNLIPEAIENPDLAMLPAEPAETETTDLKDRLSQKEQNLKK
ncbi:MAG TPA: recombinase RecT [Acidobacteriota bacterium]|mgnify:CR=1 FL=1|nr:recombinase RecT [Acidobacteriota bacterium]